MPSAARSGARLFQQGYDVTLVARGDHGRALRSGLVLEAPDETVTLPIPAVADPSAGGLGRGRDGDTVVLLAVKGQHTDHALTQLTRGAAVDARRLHAERRGERAPGAAPLPDTYGMCVMCPATQLRPGVDPGALGAGLGPAGPGPLPGGDRRPGQAIADAIATTTFQSVARPDIMRWKYRKLLMNLANAVEALCGPEGRFSPLAKEAQREGTEALGGGRHRRGQRRGGPRAPGRPPADGRHVVGGVAGRLELAEPGPRGGSIEAEFLNGEIVLLGALHGVPTPVNALLQRLALRAAAEGAPPGAWRIEDLSELAGVRHGE